MGIVMLVHQGLGLWIDRGNHWEILFPAAENWARLHGKDPIEAHEPTFLYQMTGGVARIPLRGHTLDLRSIGSGVPSAILPQPFTIALKAEHGSPATHRDPLSQFPHQVAARVLLPPGVRSPAAFPLTGPATFDRETGLLLAYATSWSADCNRTSVTVEITGPSPQTIRLTGDAAQPDLISIGIENLSASDMDGSAAGSDVDMDFAAHYLLTRTVASMPEAAPVPTLKSGSGPSTPLTNAAPGRIANDMSTKARPDRLCSSASLI